MNFFAHASLAAGGGSSFVLGAMLPDFASMAGVRLAPTGDAELDAGIAFHQRCDAVFHRAPEFTTHLEERRRAFEARGLRRGVARAVAHVGSELLLDGCLSTSEKDLATYRAALAHPVPEARLPARVHEVIRRVALAPLPESYASPAYCADRLLRILGRRPRLAPDANEARALREGLPGEKTLVRERGSAWIARVRDECAPGDAARDTAGTLAQRVQREVE